MKSPLNPSNMKYEKKATGEIMKYEKKNVKKK